MVMTTAEVGVVMTLELSRCWMFSSCTQPNLKPASEAQGGGGGGGDFVRGRARIHAETCKRVRTVAHVHTAGLVMP